MSGTERVCDICGQEIEKEWGGRLWTHVELVDISTMHAAMPAIQINTSGVAMRRRDGSEK